MNIILTETPTQWADLLPITYTRPCAAVRLGILTMAQRWQRLISGDYYWISAPHLAELFPPPPEDEDTMPLYLSGNVLATKELADAVIALKPGERLVKDKEEIARRGDDIVASIEFAGDITALHHVYDIFLYNGIAIEADFAMLTQGRTSAPIPESNTIIGDPSRIFIEEGAEVEGSTLNSRGGSIYIGKHATVMEGCHLRGPVALCDHAVANMGCLIYGPTTLGPWCKVGGELNNVVMIGYSNKGHDGFLGNAVIGEWCNLGGGTVASNLKNDYSEIKVWNYSAARFLRTGLQFCGLIMGDHSKSAINTSFNTATVVGVGCNIISEGMPRVFIPSFSKGGTAGFDNVNLEEFFAIASRVMARRNCVLTDAHKRMFAQIADFSDNFK